MNKKTRFVLSLVLMLTFVLTLVGTASASSGGPATVTPVSGDLVFSVSPVPVEKLPGQTTTAAGLIVPSGFPLGEKQFDGNGVAVSGLSYGTAKACFPISGLNQGWGGKVGYWDGSAWKLLDTNISTPAEGTFSWACANISANGTYALITWVVDASLLPVIKLTECSFADELYYNETYGYIYADGPSIGLDVPDTVPLGITANYKIIYVDPSWEGNILSGTTGSTSVTTSGSRRIAWFTDSTINFSTLPGPMFTARVTFPSLGCYVDLDFLSEGVGG